MFTYKEALDEQKRMVDFRDKHYYNAKPLKETTADTVPEQHNMKVYKF